MTTSYYAKPLRRYYWQKREPIRAVQWLGEMTRPVRDLVGDRAGVVRVDGQQHLGLDSGWCARVGDWIYSASGEDLSVISDEVFRKIYEEVDETGGVVPTDDEHEAAGREFARELDVLLLAALKLSREEHSSIFHERDRLVRTLRHLFEDQAYTAARRERHRIRNQIAEELTP